MKKTVLIFIITMLSAYRIAIAQSKIKELFILNNKVLATEVVEYDKYITDFSIGHGFKKYAITLQFKQTKEGDMITLSAVFDMDSLKKFGPSTYTILNNIPIFIRTGMEVYGLTNNNVLSNLNDIFLSAGRDTAQMNKKYASVSELMKNFGNGKKGTFDKKTTKIKEVDSKKSFEEKPQFLVLIFKDLRLVQKHRQ